MHVLELTTAEAGVHQLDKSNSTHVVALAETKYTS